METGTSLPFDSHRSFYLTLISMIQSLALGYLLTQLELKETPTVTYVLQVITTLTAIVVVWHEYAIGATLYTWIIDLWDSVIPFSFGLVQFFLITALVRKEWAPVWWFGALSCFGVVTLLAFTNQYLKARNPVVRELNEPTLQRAKMLPTMIYVVVSCVTFVAEAIGASFVDRNGWPMRGLVMASTVTVIGFAGRGLLLYPELTVRRFAGQGRTQAP